MKRHKRKRSGRKYPRRALWIERRNEAFARAGDKCEVSEEPLGKWDYQSLTDPEKSAKWKWRRAVDHIYPERAARNLVAGCDPHVADNLVCVSSSIHARKTAVEWKIFRGDYIGFVQELRCIGYSQERIDRAMRALCASVRKSEKSNSKPSVAGSART